MSRSYEMMINETPDEFYCKSACVECEDVFYTQTHLKYGHSVLPLTDWFTLDELRLSRHIGPRSAKSWLAIRYDIRRQIAKNPAEEMVGRTSKRNSVHDAIVGRKNKLNI